MPARPAEVVGFRHARVKLLRHSGAPFGPAKTRTSSAGHGEVPDLRAQRSQARTAKLICSRPNDQVGSRISQYPVSVDATSPATRIATPIPIEPTVVQRATRRSRARGGAARYRCEAYHPPTAITTISPIISTSTAQTTGDTYPAVHVANGAQQVVCKSMCPIEESGPVSDGHSRTTAYGR